ncbi:hypothetical protein V9K67_16575 [Paraflavisolibacter sp. H34]|uniref:hypothetical protein n=1 Tax=Huijunlia imazamoxiresistens TaxID=3127457 RepID=UPI0030196602
MNSDLYQVLLHLHSVGRWIVLLLLLFGIFNSLVAGSRPFIKSDNRIGLLLTIFADLMFLIGLALWVMGARGLKAIQGSGMGVVMKDAILRFFAVEHMVGMLVAIVLMHIGKAQAKKHISDRAKHRRTVIFYLIALVIILAMIPWPFRPAGEASGWY